VRRNRKVLVAKNLLKDPDWVRPRPVRKGIKTTARCVFGFSMLIPIGFLIIVFFVTFRLIGIRGTMKNIDYWG